MVELIELVDYIRQAVSQQDIHSALKPLTQLKWKAAFEGLTSQARETLSRMGFLMLKAATQTEGELLSQELCKGIVESCDLLTKVFTPDQGNAGSSRQGPSEPFGEASVAEDITTLRKAGFDLAVSNALSSLLTPWDYGSLSIYAETDTKIYEVSLWCSSEDSFNSLKTRSGITEQGHDLIIATPGPKPREVRLLLVSPLSSTAILRQKLSANFPECRVLVSLAMFPRVVTGTIDQELQQVFLEEAASQVARIEELLLRGETEGLDDESIQEAFRQAHSLKGGAASMGYFPVAEMAHSIEDVLTLIRNGEICLKPRLIGRMLVLVDLIRNALNKLAGEGMEWSGALDPISSMYDALEETNEAQLRVEIDLNGEEMVLARTVLIENELRRCANIEHRWPSDDEKDLLQAEKGLVITLKGNEEEVINILKGTGFPFSISEIQPSGDSDESHHKETESPKTTSAQVTKAEDQQGHTGPRSEAPDSHFEMGQTIRVDSRRLDHLVDLVGEILIQRQRLYEMTMELAKRSGTDINTSREVLKQLSRLTDELQHEVFKMRLVPVSTLFVRFHRLVRDLCITLKKEAELLVEGGNMEVDKHILEVLSDPLIHLVRNAIDHGLEYPEDRLRFGKPKKGRIRLACELEGSYLNIFVEDDGRGIDVSKISAKAEALGYKPELMNEEKLLELIFTPGFSTAEEISDISGRGVGLDIVKNNLSQVRGTVKVKTEPGQGTTFHLRLPLTASILDALLVEAGGQTYAVPLQDILEILPYNPLQIQRVMHGEAMVFRGESLPLIRLEELLISIPTRNLDSGNILVFHHMNRKIGLVVDKVKTVENVVLKNFSEELGHIEGIAGATILGNGQVILVLETSELLSMASKRAAPAA
ncbi:MAG: chemotaxis protein CheA [Firmicutes bacterium]|nr:chemotaxis protein CheA [Bacillota bacterium]